VKKVRSVRGIVLCAALLAVCPQGAGLGVKDYPLLPESRFQEQTIIETYESVFTDTLDADQKAGLLELLAFIEADEAVTDIRWAAYILATVRHETFFTWQPIREVGRGEGRSYGEPDPELGLTYYGRGYVQLTWRENYERAGSFLCKDLAQNPDKALEPDTAYTILSRGMLEGWFTGRSLGDYITKSTTDYVNARRVVNGTDHAERIASEAERFETFLRLLVAESNGPAIGGLAKRM